MPFDATPKVNRPAVQQNAQTLGLLGNGATANGVLVQFPGASAGYTIPTATTRGEGTQVPLTRANVTLSTGTAWPAFVTSDLPPPANALDPLADARVVGRTFEFWQMQQVDAHPPAEEGPPPDLIAPWYVYSPATGALLINHFRGELEVYLKASGVETNRSGIVVLYALQTSVDGNNWQLAGLLARKLLALALAMQAVTVLVRRSRDDVLTEKPPDEVVHMALDASRMEQHPARRFDTLQSAMFAKRRAVGKPPPPNRPRAGAPRGSRGSAAAGR